MKPTYTEKYGFEWLESDTAIYNILIEKQAQGDEILQLFNIQFMDESYQQEDMEEVNRIYIIRDETNINKNQSHHDGDVYNTFIEIIIRTSNSNSITSQALLKSCTLAIEQHLRLSNLSPYYQITKIVPRYTRPGQLREYRVELTCIEINEKELYSPYSHDLKINLMLRAKIDGGDKELQKIIPITKNKKIIPIPEYTEIKEDSEFGGGI